MPSRVLVVSPVRNEAAHIERLVRAVGAQTCPPACWIVVDDGSSDETLALLRKLERSVPFLRVHARAPEGGAVPDRLATAAESRAFNEGLLVAGEGEGEGEGEFTHIAKLDGDIELPPDYFERLLQRFDADPSLGLACGDLVEPCGGHFSRLTIPQHHVHGALKCYTRPCFESIGGVHERLGWDTIDETYARMLGFRTHSFPEIVAIHHRPYASADGTLRGRARHGACAYIAHFGPLWVTLRSLKIALQPPRAIGALAFLYGYVRAAVGHTEQFPDPAFRRYVRRELRGRMLDALRHPAGR